MYILGRLSVEFWLQCLHQLSLKLTKLNLRFVYKSLKKTAENCRISL